MIIELSESELKNIFFDLFAAVECGDYFDPQNHQHVSWLDERIHAHFTRGARSFGSFLASSQPVGFAVLLIEKKLEGADWSGQSAELLDIALYPQYRGKGFGSELLAFVSRIAAEAGVYCLYACTTASDCDVVAFYGRNGFVPVAVLPDVHGPGNEGNVYMRKLLY